MMSIPTGDDNNEVIVDTRCASLGRDNREIQNAISNHRDMCVGIHLPIRHSRNKKDERDRHREPKKSTGNGNVTKELPNGGDFLSGGKEYSERVHFLLGEGEHYGDDEEKEGPRHPIFSEMEELFYDENGQVLEWKETARWIKYEENVDHGAGRWSKPHVAALSMHSLFELRRCIKNGSVMLDMDAENLIEITNLTLDNIINRGMLEENDRASVRDAILQRHRHHKQKKTKSEKQTDKYMGRRRSSLYPGIDRTLSEIGRTASGSGSASMEQVALAKDAESGGIRKNASLPNFGKYNRSSDNLASSATSRGSFGTLEFEDKEKRSATAKFMKKVPAGSEAANVLVGEVEFLKTPMTAFVRLQEGSILHDLTEVPIPTRFVFLLLGPPTKNNRRYHEIGRCIATLMSDEVFQEVAYKARSREDLLAGIDEFMDQVTVLPPGSWDPSIRIEPPKQTISQDKRRRLDGEGEDNEKEEEGHGFTLQRTGKIFGGLLEDIKTKAPFYLSDFTDALNIQCFASFIFMYIACITPIITFGGLLGAATNDNIAAFESLLGAAICGIMYHLFSGQPLTIIGSTGPILIFEEIMFKLCESLGWYYLSFRLWIGIWTCFLCIVLVATDASALVRYFTRFTEESFSALISFIFIAEAFHNMIDVLHEYPVARNLELYDPYPVYDCMCLDNNTDVNSSFAMVSPGECQDTGGELEGDYCEDMPVPDVFFFSVILFLVTFVLAMSTKMFRFSRFFPSWVRFLISDFGVFISFIAMALIDWAMDLPTPKLTVPSNFQPTNPERTGWFVNPFPEGNPWWLCIVAILPALLCSILIFMDQQITAVIVNRKENKLKKGYGYHLDLLIVGIGLLIMSFLGLPWFVAATVLSINHVDSLRVMSETKIPGEPPKVQGCREQRVTGLLVFIMIGLSSLMTDFLSFIPMPVLYGVFLYMGISSLRGVQFVERIFLVITPAKYQPDYTFLRHVKLWRVHIFTLIQAICLAMLWVIKKSKAGIIFPLMVLALVVIRKVMEYFFTEYELSYLDDIIPESTKKVREDEIRFEEELKEEEIRTRGGTISVVLEGGQTLTVPADKIMFNTEDGKTITGTNALRMRHASGIKEVDEEVDESADAVTIQMPTRAETKL
ncbi:electrogenic sodium bicarbonate cotransporter 1-like [Antedon mediterranea]|uniref:electrogenic sodium bicarbonate cotransporter 1-like n=1 Tax=Antedon mediterranea TaxID=105859 RepID=UPI003AF40E60